MALFNVIAECVVNNKHYPGPQPGPVEVDPGAAAGLVESGALTPVDEPAEAESVEQVEAEVAADPDPEAAAPAHPRRGRPVPHAEAE